MSSLIKIESQSTESMSLQAWSKFSILVLPNSSYLVYRWWLRIPSFRFYLNWGTVRVAERRHMLHSISWKSRARLLSFWLPLEEVCVGSVITSEAEAIQHVFELGVQKMGGTQIISISLVA